MESKFEDLEMQKLNIQNDRPQREHEKNGVICQVTCLLPELRSLKCKKWFTVCIFC